MERERGRRELKAWRGRERLKKELNTCRERDPSRESKHRERERGDVADSGAAAIEDHLICHGNKGKSCIHPQLVARLSGERKGRERERERENMREKER